MVRTERQRQQAKIENSIVATITHEALRPMGEMLQRVNARLERLLMENVRRNCDSLDHTVTEFHESTTEVSEIATVSFPLESQLGSNQDGTYRLIGISISAM